MVGLPKIAIPVMWQCHQIGVVDLRAEFSRASACHSLYEWRRMRKSYDSYRRDIDV